MNCLYCGIKVFKKNKYYKCVKCGKILCLKHIYQYVDGNNESITKNSPCLCHDCYVIKYNVIRYLLREKLERGIGMKTYDEKLIQIVKAKIRKSKRKDKAERLAELSGKPKDESDFDACERLWKEIVLLRAGYRSELSGKPGKQIDKENGHILHPHHILRKPNHRLRFGLENGICLTAWEHTRGIHGALEEEYRHLIMAKRGADIYDRLYLLKKSTCDLSLVKIYLEQEFQKLKGANK